ncbi:TIGR04463 family radical SAM/SPASM RiPP maturase [Haliangium sp.]|uniref:TIGR04463 family radical SAM/SPASM RiPP maturase n=1 Tax=Haliangium sp. TaxID=2663208 RepID=UPI003D0EF51B
MPALTASRYNILVPLQNERVLAYNSLSGGLALWEDHDQHMYQRVLAGDPIELQHPVVAALIQGGFLVDDEVDELAVLEEQYQAHRFNDRTMILTIAPTLACNFACDYCFQGQDKPKESMSPEVQDAIMALVEQSADDIEHLHVAWYGGEPLARREIIEDLSDRFIAFCDDRGIKYDAMMVTNGYFLTGEAAKSMYVRRVKGVQVTIDGAPHYHDKRRVLLSGKGSFDRIVENLTEVVDATPMRISIRVNIDHRNADQIRGLIDHLHERGLSHRDTFAMYFAPIEAMTEGCHVIQPHTLTKRDYGQLEAELCSYAHDKGLAPLPYPPRFHGTCAAVRPKGLVIVPTGDIHKCWDTVTFPQHAVGSVFDLAGLEQSDKAKAWDQWTPFANDTCRNCKILPNCSGACAYKFIHAGDTRGEAAVLPCPSWKYNIKERLVLRAERSGVITAEDYDRHEIRTEPSELCAEVHVEGGNALPDSMQAELARAAS